MSKNRFFAKTANLEKIQQHTDKLLSRYYELRALYPEIPNLNWKALRIVCVYHDFGKMNSKFQNKIMKKLNEMGYEFELLEDEIGIDEIPHGYLSCAFLEEEKLKNEFSEDDIRVIYQSIYYHHNRDPVDSLEISKIINSDMSIYLPDFNYLEYSVPDKLNPKYSKWVKKRISKREYPENQEMINQYIMVKGLLNRIDYSASGDISVEKNHDNLYTKTINYFENNNLSLNELQNYIIENRDKHNIIIASTGIGKTEAALLWIGNEKGFFTLPLKVSINAIYDRIKDNIGHDRQKLGLLHSDMKMEYIQRNNGNLDLDLYNHAKQMSMPLTVCTLDQLIDFVFKCEGYELKMATLSYSKLVIDEIQMYSPEMIGYLILALRDIHYLGGKFCILTATLPPIFLNFLNKQIPDYEFYPQIFCKKNSVNKDFIRHKIKVHEKSIESAEILSEAGNKKILVIVNTVKKAQQLYDEIKDQADVKLLHSRFIKKHRKLKEDDILKDGSKISSKPVIWIATQIVEASLDIDFDILYTELSDISGLFQRMGRVYRSRELDQENANVHIYTGEKYSDISGIGYVVDKEIFTIAREKLISMGECIITEKDKMMIVEELYSEKNMKTTSYYKKIKQTIIDYKDITEYELQKNEVKLREIKSRMVIPNSVYKEYENDIKFNICKMNKAENVSKKIILKEDIIKYTLSIPEMEFEKARNSGCCAQEISVDKYTFIPVIDYAYDEEMGLRRHNQNINAFCVETQFV